MRTKVILGALLFFVILGNIMGGWTTMGACAAVLGGIALGLEFVKDSDKKSSGKKK